VSGPGLRTPLPPRGPSSLAARPEVSVCIATTRPAGLARLLESLARQKLPPGLAMEVVVADDAPGDASRAAAEAWEGPGPLRRLEVGARNVAAARNRAVDAAAGRWLAFVDDDETVEEEWLAAYLERVRAGFADGCFGPVIPRLERVVKPWLDPEFFYARPRHPTGTLLAPGDLRTSNAWLRASLFQGRRFDPAYGRSGGSDTELFGRMLRSGARFEWCDEARVVEWIGPERHRLRWLARRAFRGGVVWTRIERERGARRGGWRGLVRALAAGGALAAALPWSLLAGLRAAARVGLGLATQAGHVWAHLGRDFEEYGE
jgi:glycosyltransferase involved in cell wall biosynthesis